MRRSLPECFSVTRPLSCNGPWTFGRTSGKPNTVIKRAKYFPPASFKMVRFEFSASWKRGTIDLGEFGVTVVLHFYRGCFAVYLCGLRDLRIYHCFLSPSVPATLASTSSLSDPCGILEKSAGSLSGSL